MPASLESADQRFLQQAEWTRAIRDRAFARFGLSRLQRLIEIGSGTGVITSELQRASSAMVVGLDRDARANAFALAAHRLTASVTGLGEQLPFPAGTFDLVCCHFLLLWVADPRAVILEMKRVTRPGGVVLCLAEPDYGGRIDYPEGLAALGAMQEKALQAQAADTRLGRRLRALLHQCGLMDVQAGVLGGEWHDGDASAEARDDSEWRTLAADLGAYAPAKRLSSMQADFARARRERSCVLFVPTFFGWGTRPARDIL
jgi:SAM-dependent methyltransferase